MKNSESLKEF